MARVHNQNQADQLAALLQVVAQEFDPVRTDGLRYLRVAVAGQIDHEIAVFQFKEIDVLGAARCFGNIGKAHMIG